MTKSEFKQHIIKSARTSVACEVCNARPATVTVVEFIQACGRCAKKIDSLTRRKT